MKVKVRTVGNSNTFTIPKEIYVEKGAEFEVEQKDDGSIVFMPKHRNPFEGNWFNKNLDQTGSVEDAEDIDSEWS